MKTVYKLKNSLVIGFAWVLLITVLSTRAYESFVHCYHTFKSQDIENAGDETQSPDNCDNELKKSDKSVFSFFEDHVYSSYETNEMKSTHRGVYSFSIFKEPLRDILTPPPNHLSA